MSIENETNAYFAKDWELRKAISQINKARRGAHIRQNGMARLTLEYIDRKEKFIRDEMARRKAPTSSPAPANEQKDER